MTAIRRSPAGHDVPRRTVAERARRLAYLTVGWTALEAVVAVWAAATAGSVALLGFGVDSVIEVVSGATVLWRFSGEFGEARERRAAQFVGWSLLALGTFVTLDSVTALVRRHEPDVSVAGIVLTAAAVLIMPRLARSKRRVAAETGSRALAGDASQSSICAWLSAITLAGLGLRAVADWWWADAAAALVLVPLIVKEGVGVLRAKSLGDGCCNTC